MAKPVPPPGLPFWRDHFVCEGSLDLSLVPGSYPFEIERGPEYEVLRGHLTVPSNSDLAPPRRFTHRLRRLTRLSDEGWWSGDLHVHRPLTDIERLMRAEDLATAPVITWWNSRGPWARQPIPASTVVGFETNRFYAPLSDEDERGGGALLFHGLPQPLPLDGSDREFPSSTRFLLEARGSQDSWVDLEMGRGRPTDHPQGGDARPPFAPP